MINIFLIIAVLSLTLFCVPFIALADMHEINTVNPVSCGLKCVIETKGFDTHEEAIFFSTSKQGKIYKLSGNDLWFVDYQVTEQEANLM